MTFIQVRVYHVTTHENADKIVKEGFKPIPGGTNLYGRGNYFWTDKGDADACIKRWFYGKGTYVYADINIHISKIVVYDELLAQKAPLSGSIAPNHFSKKLLYEHDVNYLLIPSHYMAGNKDRDGTTELGEGKPKYPALLQLVDVEEHFNELESLLDFQNELPVSSCNIIDKNIINLRSYANLIKEALSSDDGIEDNETGYSCSYCNSGVVKTLPAYCPSCKKYLTVIKPEKQTEGYYICSYCGDSNFKKVPGFCPSCGEYLKGFLPN